MQLRALGETWPGKLERGLFVRPISHRHMRTESGPVPRQNRASGKDRCKVVREHLEVLESSEKVGEEKGEGRADLLPTLAYQAKTFAAR